MCCAKKGMFTRERDTIMIKACLDGGCDPRHGRLLSWLYIENLSEKQKEVLTENRRRAGPIRRAQVQFPVRCYTKVYLAYIGINNLTAKLCNLNFHPLEVVSRWRDPQLQVSENYSDLTKWRSTLFKSCWLMSHFILNIFKMWYLMC